MLTWLLVRPVIHIHDSHQSCKINTNDSQIIFSGGLKIKDVCFIDSEADDQEILNAISQTKISTLFTKGFRGKKYNIDIIVDFIKKLQQLDVKEMDINPVIFGEDSLTVADVRLLESTK